MIENLFVNKSIYDTVDTLEKYKYSGKVFTNKYVTQFLVVLLTNLTTLILITIDGFVAAHFIGEDALNSVNLLNPFVLIMGAVTIFLAGGVNIVLSKTYGIGSKELKQKIFRAVVLLTVIFMVGETILQIPVSYFMINSYMVDQEIKSMMELYVIGMIITNTVSIINTVCSYIFIASGKTKILLKLAILESSLHIVFDLFLVVVLNMGILGAGLGTAISCTIRGIVSIIFVQRILGIFPIAKVNCRTEMKDILFNGFPLMVRQLLISLAVYAINMYIVFCDIGLEAVTVISVCAFGGSVAIMIINSFVQASNSIIGILVGSADWEIVRDLGRKIIYIYQL